MTPAKKAPAAKTPANAARRSRTDAPAARSASSGKAATAGATAHPARSASKAQTSKVQASKAQASKTGVAKAARPSPKGAGGAARADTKAKTTSAKKSSAVRDGAPAGARATRPPAKGAGGPYADDAKFLGEQRHLLDHERDVYRRQAADLQAEAESLAQEREPGDVQFDEESGEGGTVTVDRERDLALSAQALAAVEEIEGALRRVDDKTYGACERCHQAIPKARLRALPYARLCVACKSGGLSRR